MPTPSQARSSMPEQKITYKMMDYILKDNKPNETASRRLKQASLMAYIYVLHANGNKVTISDLCCRLNAPRKVITEIVNDLKSRELLTYYVDIHSGRKGRVYVYTPSSKAMML